MRMWHTVSAKMNDNDGDDDDDDDGDDNKKNNINNRKKGLSRIFVLFCL